MNEKDLLQEYKELLGRTVELEHKVTTALTTAVDQLDAERKKLEDQNNRGWLEKHKTLLLATLPLIALVIVFFGAFIFVSSGHTINLKVGDYQVEAR